MPVLNIMLILLIVFVVILQLILSVRRHIAIKLALEAIAPRDISYGAVLSQEITRNHIDRSLMDLKYDILKHPAVDLTADGKGGVYQHGKVTSNVATIEVQYLDPDTLPDTEVSETTYELLSDEDFNSETNNNTTTKLRR